MNQNIENVKHNIKMLENAINIIDENIKKINSQLDKINLFQLKIEIKKGERTENDKEYILYQNLINELNKKYKNKNKFNLQMQVVNNNLSYYLQEEFKPIVNNILKKYNNKSLGTKTTEKIKKEFKEISLYKNSYIVICDKIIKVFIDFYNNNSRIEINYNVKDYNNNFLVNNKLQIQEFKGSCNLIEDPISYVNNFLEEKQKIIKLQKEYNKQVDIFIKNYSLLVYENERDCRPERIKELY